MKIGTGNGIWLNVCAIRVMVLTAVLLEETYIRVDFKNSEKPRHKTNLKVWLINNIVREKGGILMICNPAIMASK